MECFKFKAIVHAKGRGTAPCTTSSYSPTITKLTESDLRSRDFDDEALLSNPRTLLLAAVKRTEPPNVPLRCSGLKVDAMA